MKQKIFNLMIVIVDMLLINLGFYLAFMMKFDFNPPRYNLTPYIEIIPFITVAALLYFDLYGLLSAFKKSLYETMYSIILAVLLLCITTIAITYINQGFSFPRSILLVTPIIQISFLILWRMIIWEARKYILKKKDVVVIGASQDEMDKIVEKIKAPAANMLLNVKYTCDSADIGKIIRAIDLVDEVFICSNTPSENKDMIIRYCMNKDKGIYIIPDFSEILLYKSQMLQFDDIPTFVVEDLKLSLLQRLVKRTFDTVFSIIAIVLFIPLMLIAVMAVRIGSKGPILYNQKRVTRGGKTFKLYKFRTMIENAEKHTGPTLSTEGDERITPVGKVLRKYRIDELPQLFNVLKGEMSLVGPRPERPYYVEQYEKEIPGYEYRTSVKAGITGLAQVLGKYTTQPEDKLRYDLFYIRSYSILFDIKIILQTLNVILNHNSAAGCKLTDDEAFEGGVGYKKILNG